MQREIMHLLKLNQKSLGVWETKLQSFMKRSTGSLCKSAAGWPFFVLSHKEGFVNTYWRLPMKTPDYDFWNNLARLQNLHAQIGRIVKYTDHDGIPLDLNYPQGKSEVEAFKHFATTLEDKALEFSELAETITTYTGMMEDILSEKENEMLPDEGNPGVAVGG